MGPVEQSNCTLHVAFVCFPAWGHLTPLLSLAEEVAAAGHKVTVLTSNTAIQKCRTVCSQTGVYFHGLDDGLEPEWVIENLRKPDTVHMHPLAYAGSQMKAPLLKAVKEMDPAPDLIISDHLSVAGSEVAKELGISHGVHSASPLAAMRTVGALPAHNIAEYWDRLKHLIKLGRGPPTGFLALVSSAASSGLLLVSSCWGFGPDLPRAVPPRVKMIGRFGVDRPGDWADHTALKTFLDRHETVVYVSFGSRLPPSHAQVRALAGGLAGGGYGVVWSLKEESQAQLPPGGLDEGTFFIRSWLPQALLLTHEHVRAVVSHCGWGAMCEILGAGKPLVAQPLGGMDQHINAKGVVESGCGLWPQQTPLTAAAVSSAVRTILDDPKYAENARKQQRALLAGSRTRAAVDAIESVAMYGDQHLKLQDKPSGWEGPVLPALLTGTVLGATAAIAVHRLLRRQRT